MLVTAYIKPPTLLKIGGSQTINNNLLILWFVCWNKFKVTDVFSVNDYFHARKGNPILNLEYDFVAVDSYHSGMNEIPAEICTVWLDEFAKTD